MTYLLGHRTGRYFFTKLCIVLSVSFSLYAQTTIDLDEFNAAYFQYGHAKDSQPEVAREAARRAYELGRELFGAESERSAMLAINYATMLESEAETRIYLDEAVATFQSVFGFGSEEMIDPLVRLGQALSDQGRLDLSQEYYNRALELSQIQLGLDSSKVGVIELELGALKLRVGPLDQAWTHLQKAKEVLSNYSDPGSRSGVTRAHLLIGEYYLARQDFRSAISPLLLSLQEFNRYPSADITVRNHIALIKAYENLNESGKATRHCLAIGSTRRLEQNENLRPVYRISPEGFKLANSIRVNFTVNVDGYVHDPHVVTEIEDEVLKKALTDAIQKFRFAPRFVEGSFVESPNQYYEFR